MENTQSEAMSLAPKGYVPPKAWVDITADEKIERLREIIKGLQQAVGRNQTDINKVKDNFKNHSHSEKGILVPYNEYGGSGLGLVGESAKSANVGFF